VEDKVGDTTEEDSILEVEDSVEDIRDTLEVVVEAENSLVEGEVDNNRLWASTSQSKAHQQLRAHTV